MLRLATRSLHTSRRALSQAPRAERAVSSEAAAAARKAVLDAGYDEPSLHEQPVVWGDLDSFRHVNNVRYVRYFESGRIKWMSALGQRVGGADMARDMLAGRGVSLILKSINVDFKRPVTYPDTLLIAHRVQSWTEHKLYLDSIAYSYVQQRVVTESLSVCVWYDYDQLAKATIPPNIRRALTGREATRAVKPTIPPNIRRALTGREAPRAVVTVPIMETLNRLIQKNLRDD